MIDLNVASEHAHDQEQVPRFTGTGKPCSPITRPGERGDEDNYLLSSVLISVQRPASMAIANVLSKVYSAVQRFILRRVQRASCILSDVRYIMHRAQDAR